MKTLTKYIVLFFILLFSRIEAYSQLNIATGQTVQQLVEDVLVGQGVVVTNITYTGANNTITSFSNGNTTNLGLTSGIVLASGNVNNIDQAASSQMSNNMGTGGDAQLDAICSANTYDGAVLQFDFVPLSDTIKFRYIFGSEEYPNYVCSGFNDVFGFFVSGPNPAGGSYTNKNIALIPGTNLPVAINTVNSGNPGSSYNASGCQSTAYSSLFTNNTGGATIVFNGFTNVLTAWCKVTPCQTYHIKIAISDAGDHILDSGVFLEANSFSSGNVTVSTGYQDTSIDTVGIENCNNGLITFRLANPAASNTAIAYTLSGTATNGVDYTAIPTNGIVIPAGQDSFSLVIEPLFDGITEGNETVILDVQTSLCGTERYTILIRDNTPLVLNAGSDVSTCTSPVTFSASLSGGITPYHYNWSNGGGTSNIATYNPVVSTTYIVTATDLCSSSATDNVAVTIGSANVNAGSDQTICSDQSITVTASGALNYAWSNTVNNASITVSPNSTTTYTVTGTSAGCTGTDQVVVYVHPTFTTSITPSVSNICQGQSSTLTATNGVSYIWSDSQTGTPINVAPAINTTYTVTATDANTCTASNSIGIAVQPQISILASPATICEGNSTQLTCSGGTGYLWSPTTGLSSSAISNPIASPSVSTTYSVTVTDGACTQTASVIVTVNSLPTANAGADATICTGNSSTLSASGGISYLWSTTQPASSITVTPINSFTYTVTVTDNNGCSDSDDVIVNITPLPTAEAGANQTICSGNSAILTATGGTSFVWETSETSNSITVNPITNTTYSVTVTNNNCTAVDSVYINVTNPPIVNAGNNQTICAGTNTTLTATGGGTYLWETSSTSNSIIVAPLVSTTYSVTVTKNNCSVADSVYINVTPLPTVDAGRDETICYGQSIALTALGGGTYEWNTSELNYTITVNPLVNTTYIVTVTNNNCEAIDSVFVDVIPLPLAEAGANQTICAGTSISLNGIGGDSLYWSDGISDGISFNPTSTTTFTLTTDTIFGCSSTDNVIITVNPLPTIVASSDHNSICLGESVTLSVTAGSSYYWYSNPVILSSILQNPTHSPTTTTTYTASVTDANGCTNTSTKIVIVNPLPTADAGTNQTICEREELHLTASGGTNYSWNSDASLTSTTINNPDASPLTTTTYTVTINDNNGCSDQDSVIITVTPLPIVDAGANQTICAGSITNITATGGGTYYWETTETSNSISVNPASNSIYSVTVTANSCSAIDSVTIFVTPLPIANAGLDKTICYGNNTTLTASGGTSYLWNTSDATATTTSLNPTVNTTYTVTVTANNCSAIDSAYIHVTPLPITEAGSDQTICAGASASLVATGGTTYHWENNTNNDTAIVSPIINTTYSVTATTNGCSSLDSVIINVTPLPIANAGANQSICVGDTIALTATGGTSYIWNTTETTTSISVHPLTNLTYTVTVSANNCSATDNVSVSIYQLPTANAGIDKTICYGSSTTINGSGGNSYLWSSGAMSQNTTVSPLTDSTFYLTVTDNHGCKDIDEIFLHVDHILTNWTDTVNIKCFGENSGSIRIIASGGNAPYTYHWSTPINSITNTASNLYANTPYRITVTDTYGCTSTNTVTLAERPNLIFSLSTFNAACSGTASGQAIALAIGGTAPYSYTWLPMNTTSSSPSITNLLAGNYSLEIRDAYQCSADTNFSITQPSELHYNLQTVDVTCFSGSNGEASVSASGGVPPYHYQWSNFSTDSLISGLTSNTYSVTVSDFNNCNRITPVYIHQPNAINITTSNDTIICKGTDVIISSNATGGTPPYSFIWSNADSIVGNLASISHSPAATTTYSVSVTDDNLCTTGLKNVIVNLFPSLALITSPSTGLCIGDSVIISASAYGGNGGPYNYTWNTNETTNSIYAHPTINSKYYVTATDNCSQPAISDSIAVIVNSIPTIDFVADTLEGCSPLNVNFSFISSNSISSFEWNFGDFSSTENTSTDSLPNHTYEASGNFSINLAIVDTNGCPNSIYKHNYIEVYPIPNADFTFDPLSGDIEHSLINFYAIQDSSISSYLWNFGDPMSGSNDSSSLPVTFHEFTNPEIFNVCLKVSNAKACSDIICKNVQILDKYSFFIPNAFTPGTDGVNDEWKPVASGYLSNDYKMVVFNRWGGLVFESTDVERGWNGKFMNKKVKVQPDVYVYIIQIKDLTGATHNYTGNVTVVR